jgi:hypothetical protein
LHALLRFPLLKAGTTAAALLCVGGAAFVGSAGSGSSPAPAGPAPALDHYLCTPGLGRDCRSVAVTLPDGTAPAVGDPDARLRCDRAWSWHHRHDDGETVEVTNELSPAGADGPTAVALVETRLRGTCALTTPAPGTTARVGRRAPRAEPTVLARFACFTVEYPSRGAVRFTTPAGLEVGDRLRLDVRGPAALCLAADPSAAEGGGPNALVCFETRARARWWRPVLCVPSSTDASTTTTTSAPPDSSTTTTGDTSTSTTTESTTSTSTTTSTTTTSQPCPGTIIDGICVINL